MSIVAVKSHSPRPGSRGSSVHLAGKTPWASLTPKSSTLRVNRTDPGFGIDDFDLFRTDGEEAWKTALDDITALGLALEDTEQEERHSDELPRISLEGPEHGADQAERPPSVAKPFHKWMKNLHKRAHRSSLSHTNHQVEAFPEYTFNTRPVTPSHHHRRTSSDSSFNFVAAVRSASVSLASASIATRSRRQTARSSRQSRADRSSRGSTSAPRFSEDSTCFERTLMADPGVTERLLQRRRILEELISTEESYIGDIKFLMNVYVTILAALPTPHPGLRSSINRNLTEIVELHEEILGELHAVVPNSEYTQPEKVTFTSNPPPPSKRHHRLRSLDSVPEVKGGSSWLQGVPSVIAEPAIAAEVARVFGKRMNRFFVYEEYGAKYEMMIKDVASAHRTLPHWDSYQKGLEALAASLGTVSSHMDNAKKSLTIGDLLVKVGRMPYSMGLLADATKPIQRICRYPLLFAELLKYTPVCDCPSSHMEIDDVLIRLREATAEINRATDDPHVKVTMEQTWTLQDRLVFPNQRLDGSSKTTIRSFGQVRLCGALHISWQSREGVNGQYMVAVLYKDCLCLATAGKADQTYTIQACISLDSIKIEEPDNGRGLQCHTAPFSWKLVFECDHQLYEVIMTACSRKEEIEWRARLGRPAVVDTQISSEPAVYSSVSLSLKSLGTVFGKPGTVARRLSIHRATTVGPKSPLCQVILKNTTTVKDTSTTSTSPINRSQSLLTTNSRVPLLAPARADRVRLEALLADVWSRHILPFPGISSRSKSENLVRSSASTMMRKLSVAGITNSFSKRSASSASINRPNDGDVPHGRNFLDSRGSLSRGNSTPSLGRGEVEGEICGRTLPMIRDETERTSSGSTGFLNTDSAATYGTVRRRERSRLNADGIEENRLSTPGMRTVSGNSIRRGSTPSIKSSPPCPADAESICQGSENSGSVRESLRVARSPSKWSRMSAMNRGLVPSGLRSLFR
ncbi:hypothetical protein F4780DRAFT_441219 [Xylariomycetidae sp. FL0641]|nr:hypothetical protein F4780DRAFT_441219 [Xylariomycetidae sp. FL0641]